MAVDIDLPKHFERKMRDDLSASASNINLREYSHYFFEVGLSLAMAKGDNDLRVVLTKAFAGDRFDALMVQALSRSIVLMHSLLYCHNNEQYSFWVQCKRSHYYYAF